MDAHVELIWCFVFLFFVIYLLKSALIVMQFQIVCILVCLVGITFKAILNLFVQIKWCSNLCIDVFSMCIYFFLFSSSSICLLCLPFYITFPAGYLCVSHLWFTTFLYFISCHHPQCKGDLLQFRGSESFSWVSPASWTSLKCMCSFGRNNSTTADSFII